MSICRNRQAERAEQSGFRAKPMRFSLSVKIRDGWIELAGLALMTSAPHRWLEYSITFTVVHNGAGR
jgi:hypothetical protein